MSRLLIADDNSSNIKIIKNAFKYSNLEIRHTFVLNKRENISKTVEKNNIEIIFFNIDIYESRTFSIIKSLVNKYPDIKFIYYGKIADNDYLQKLTSMNCYGILYKPLLSVEVEKILNELKVRLNAQAIEKKYNEKVEERIIKHRLWFKEKFLYNVINGSITNIDEMNRGFHHYNISLSNQFQVAIIKIDKFRKILLALDEEDKNRLSLKLNDTIRHMLKSEKFETIISNFNEFIIIIDSDKEVNEIISLFKKIKDNIYDINNLRVTIGLGRSYSNSTDISVSFKEAKSALQYRFYVGYNSVISIEHVEPNNKFTYRYPLDKENKLVYTAVIGEYSDCENLIEQIFDSIKEIEFIDSTLIQKIIMDILISINRNLTERNILLYNLFEEYFLIEDVMRLRNVNSAKQYLLENLKPFCEKMILLRSEKENDVFQLINNYINDYYYETIDFNKMGKISGTSEEFIEKIFFDKTGKSVGDYITNKRLVEAKKMMRESNKDDDYIAMKTGFHDKHQFRELFEKKFNITTIKYKKKYNINNVKENGLYSIYKK